jgi:hypothetical protein
MHGTFLSGKRVFAVGAAVTAAVAITGCGGGYVARHSPAMRPGEPNHSHVANPGAGTTQARAKAKAEVTNCVNKEGTTGMVSSSGRTAVTDCIENLVPPDKRDALKACLSHAVARDKVYTPSGRAAFESKDAPACLNAAR